MQDCEPALLLLSADSAVQSELILLLKVQLE